MIGKLHYYRISNLNEDKANRKWLHFLFLPPLPSLPVTSGVCSSTLYGHWTFLKSQGTWRLRLFSIRSSWFLPLLEKKYPLNMSKDERTFLMIKPDAVHRGLIADIIKRFEQKGFKLVAMKFVKVRCFCVIPTQCLIGYFFER